MSKGASSVRKKEEIERGALRQARRIQEVKKEGKQDHLTER